MSPGGGYAVAASSSSVAATAPATTPRAAYGAGLERARDLQRDECAATLIRTELQQLVRGAEQMPVADVMVAELRLLEAERSELQRTELHEQMWNNELLGRLSQSPPCPSSRYYPALTGGAAARRPPTLPGWESASPQEGGSCSPLPVSSPAARGVPPRPGYASCTLSPPRPTSLTSRPHPGSP